MKNIFLILLVFLKIQSVYAQQCVEADVLKTTQMKNIIRQYISDYPQKNYFFEDKGIVVLTQYNDVQGQVCRSIRALVDNRYLKNPPDKYTWCDNDVILVYQGDKQGNKLPSGKSAIEIENCLSEIIGGRVYAYENKTSNTFYIDDKGNRKLIRMNRDFGGNIHNELIIVFHKDLSIERRIPA